MWEISSKYRRRRLNIIDIFLIRIYHLGILSRQRPNTYTYLLKPTLQPTPHKYAIQQKKKTHHENSNICKLQF